MTHKKCAFDDETFDKADHMGEIRRRVVEKKVYTDQNPLVPKQDYDRLARYKRFRESGTVCGVHKYRVTDLICDKCGHIQGTMRYLG